MSLNYAYNYAYVDPDTHMCFEVRSSTDDYLNGEENWVVIPVNDEDYVGKFYIDGNWYEDPAGTIPWQSSML